MKIYLVLLLISLVITVNNFAQVQFNSHVITMNAPNVEEIYAADIDGDGDTNVLAASAFDDRFFYENDENENYYGCRI